MCASSTKLSIFGSSAISGAHEKVFAILGQRIRREASLIFPLRSKQRKRKMQNIQVFFSGLAVKSSIYVNNKANVNFLYYFTNVCLPCMIVSLFLKRKSSIFYRK